MSEELFKYTPTEIRNYIDGLKKYLTSVDMPRRHSMSHDKIEQEIDVWEAFFKTFKNNFRNELPI